MELRQLRYFVAVAEDKHFNRAAERLHIAQPAISQQIRRLEQELKVTLLDRNTRYVELTDAGRVFLTEARRVLADTEHALAAVRHAAGGEAGLLRIAFVGSAALRILPSLVLAMHERWPQVQLRLQEHITDQQLAAIRERRVDVGIVREMDPTDGIITQEILREPLVLAVPTSHQLAGRRRVRLHELAGERFVVFPRHQVSRLYDHIAALCHHAGVTFDVAQEAVQFPTILGLVAARSGVAIVPDSLQSLKLPGLNYVPIADKEAYSTVSLVCSEDRRHSPLVANCFTTARTLDHSA